MVGDLRVCGDGGANRLLDQVKESKQSLMDIEPDAICGDLDSIRPDVRAHYSERDVMIKDLSEDQDTTDHEKCLNFAEVMLKKGGIPVEDSTVLVTGQ